MRAEKRERALALTASFKERLSADTREMNRNQRFAWLLRHVEEYVGRWVGLSHFDHVTMESLLESDIHTVLLIGIDAVDDEVRSVQDDSNSAKGLEAFLQEWSDFAGLVRSLRSESTKQVSTQVAEGFQRVRVSFGGSEWGQADVRR